MRLNSVAARASQCEYNEAAAGDCRRVPGRRPRGRSGTIIPALRIGDQQLFPGGVPRRGGGAKVLSRAGRWGLKNVETVTTIV